MVWLLADSPRRDTELWPLLCYATLYTHTHIPASQWSQRWEGIRQCFHKILIVFSFFYDGMSMVDNKENSENEKLSNFSSSSLLNRSNFRFFFILFLSLLSWVYGLFDLATRCFRGNHKKSPPRPGSPPPSIQREEKRVSSLAPSSALFRISLSLLLSIRQISILPIEGGKANGKFSNRPSHSRFANLGTSVGEKK